MIYVVNDLHGAPQLIEKTVEAIKELNNGESLIINGDGAGARGPIMNKIVKIYYEVRRGESPVSTLLDAIEEIIGEKPGIPQAWIYEAVHAGLFRKLMAERYPRFAECMRKELKDVIEETLNPITKAACEQGVQIIYLPGNGEIVPDDFITDDITTERTVEPRLRYYRQLDRSGYFAELGVSYVQHARKYGEVALISTNLLDMSHEEIITALAAEDMLYSHFSKVVVHYPPAVAPIGGMFDFWTPNKTDIQRINTLNWILSTLMLEKDVEIFFGHIHLGANDARMEPFPSLMTFDVDKMHCTWVKPGVVAKVAKY